LIFERCCNAADFLSTPLGFDISGYQQMNMIDHQDIGVNSALKTFTGLSQPVLLKTAVCSISEYDVSVIPAPNNVLRISRQY